MNQHFTTLKKAVEVFHTYGITVSGQRKNDHFIQKLDMHPVYINGLIFELEFQLQIFIQDEKICSAKTPKELVSLFLSLQVAN